MGWICRECGKRYPLLIEGQRKWGPPDKCNNTVTERPEEKYVKCRYGKHDLMHAGKCYRKETVMVKCRRQKCKSFCFEEDKNSEKELLLMAKLYEHYFKIPPDISMHVFTKICNHYSWPACGSGHPAGQCIHNKECIEDYMREQGFIMPKEI